MLQPEGDPWQLLLQHQQQQLMAACELQVHSPCVRTLALQQHQVCISRVVLRRMHTLTRAQLLQRL